MTQRASEPEIGWQGVEVTEEGKADPLIGPMAPSFEAFQWHSYESLLPEGAVILARSPVCIQAYRVGEVAWGIQFHAEVTAADAGKWIDEYRSTRTRCASGLTPRRCGRETGEKIG